MSAAARRRSASGRSDTSQSTQRGDYLAGTVSSGDSSALELGHVPDEHADESVHVVGEGPLSPQLWPEARYAKTPSNWDLAAIESSDGGNGSSSSSSSCRSSSRRGNRSGSRSGAQSGSLRSGSCSSDTTASAAAAAAAAAASSPRSSAVQDRMGIDPDAKPLSELEEVEDTSAGIVKAWRTSKAWVQRNWREAKRVRLMPEEYDSLRTYTPEQPFNMPVPWGVLCWKDVPFMPETILKPHVWAALQERCGALGITPRMLQVIFLKLCPPTDSALGTVRLKQFFSMFDVPQRRLLKKVVLTAAKDKKRMFFEDMIMLLVEFCSMSFYDLLTQLLGVTVGLEAIDLSAARGLVRFLYHSEVPHELIRLILKHLHSDWEWHTPVAFAHLCIRYPLLVQPLLATQRVVQRKVFGLKFWTDFHSKRNSALLPMDFSFQHARAISARVIMLEAVSAETRPFLFGSAQTATEAPQAAASAITAHRQREIETLVRNDPDLPARLGVEWDTKRRSTAASSIWKFINSESRASGAGSASEEATASRPGSRLSRRASGRVAISRARPSSAAIRPDTAGSDTAGRTLPAYSTAQPSIAVQPGAAAIEAAAMSKFTQEQVEAQPARTARAISFHEDATPHTEDRAATAEEVTAVVPLSGAAPVVMGSGQASALASLFNPMDTVRVQAMSAEEHVQLGYVDALEGADKTPQDLEIQAAEKGVLGSDASEGMGRLDAKRLAKFFNHHAELLIDDLTAQDVFDLLHDSRLATAFSEADRAKMRAALHLKRCNEAGRKQMHIDITAPTAYAAASLFTSQLHSMRREEDMHMRENVLLTTATGKARDMVSQYQQSHPTPMGVRCLLNSMQAAKLVYIHACSGLGRSVGLVASPCLYTGMLIDAPTLAIAAPEAELAQSRGASTLLQLPQPPPAVQKPAPSPAPVAPVLPAAELSNSMPAPVAKQLEEASPRSVESELDEEERYMRMLGRHKPYWEFYTKLPMNFGAPPAHFRIPRPSWRRLRRRMRQKSKAARAAAAQSMRKAWANRSAIAKDLVTGASIRRGARNSWAAASRRGRAWRSIARAKSRYYKRQVRGAYAGGVGTLAMQWAVLKQWSRARGSAAWSAMRQAAGDAVLHIGATLEAKAGRPLTRTKPAASQQPGEEPDSAEPGPAAAAAAASTAASDPDDVLRQQLAAAAAAAGTASAGKDGEQSAIPRAATSHSIDELREMQREGKALTFTERQRIRQWQQVEAKRPRGKYHAPIARARSFMPATADEMDAFVAHRPGTGQALATRKRQARARIQTAHARAGTPSAGAAGSPPDGEQRLPPVAAGAASQACDDSTRSSTQTAASEEQAASPSSRAGLPRSAVTTPLPSRSPSSGLAPAQAGLTVDTELGLTREGAEELEDRQDLQRIVRAATQGNLLVEAADAVHEPPPHSPAHGQALVRKASVLSPDSLRSPAAREQLKRASTQVFTGDVPGMGVSLAEVSSPQGRRRRANPKAKPRAQLYPAVKLPPAGGYRLPFPEDLQKLPGNTGFCAVSEYYIHHCLADLFGYKAAACVLSASLVQPRGSEAADAANQQAQANQQSLGYVKLEIQRGGFLFDDDLWIELYDDEDEAFFYYNVATGYSTWDEPDEYVPAE